VRYRPAYHSLDLAAADELGRILSRRTLDEAAGVEMSGQQIFEFPP
jgi:hypothetical protein